jgi:FMN phosphatase YigB (HAD superfamily)
MNKLAILDIDGVLADFEARFCAVFGNEHREKCSIQERYPKMKNEIDRFVFQSNTYRNLSVIPLGERIYKKLKDDNWLIWILTARPAGTCGMTEFWLRSHHFAAPFNAIGGNKLDMAKFLNPAILIDDDGNFCVRAREAGMNAWLLDWPWNQHVDCPRIHTFEDFETALLETGL